MKKKYLLTFILFISAFFCFGIKGRADTTCSYTMGEISFNQIGGNISEKYDDGMKYVKFYNYLLYQKYGKDYINLLNAKHKETDIPYLTWIENYLLNKMFPTDDFKKNMIINSTISARITYSDGDKSYIIDYLTSDFTVFEGKTESVSHIVRDDSPWTKLDYRGKCPDLLILKPNMNYGFGTNPYHLITYVDAIYIDDYLNLSKLNLPSDIYDGEYLIAITQDRVSETPNFYDYYEGSSCLLNNFRYMNDFSLINDINSVFDYYNDKGFPYMLYIERADDFDISGLPYFKESDQIQAKEKLQEHKKILSKYKNYVIDCLEKTKEDSDSYKSFPSPSDWLSNYSNDKGNYVAAMLSVLEKAEQDYETIKDALEANFIQSIVEETCPNTDEECITNECKKLYDFKCYDLVWNLNTNNSVEVAIYNKYYDSCSSTYNPDEESARFGTCMIESCIDEKEKWETQCSKAATGKTKYQEKLQEINEKVYADLVKIKGIDVFSGSELCNILKSDAELGKYIDIALNIIRIGGPILVIILTGLDAMRAIGGSKEEENKKFFDRLRIRLICVAILILVPTIIDFAVNLFITTNCK